MIAWVQETTTTAGAQETSAAQVAEIASAVATTVAAMGTLVLALYAIRAAGINRGTLQEMRETRLAEERPYVVVDLDWVSRYPFVDIIVRNDGKRAARNVRFHFSAPLVDYKGLELSSAVGYFDRGLNVLAPGVTIPCTIGNSQQVIRIFRDRGLDGQGITVTVEYESLEGIPHEDEWNLNPVLFTNRQLVELDDPLKEAAAHLEGIRYAITLETRRPTWRRIFNIRAYDQQSPWDQVGRYRWQRPLHWLVRPVARYVREKLEREERNPWWLRLFYGE